MTHLLAPIALSLYFGHDGKPHPVGTEIRHPQYARTMSRLANGAPSFGGIVVLQVLQMVEARAGGRFDFDDANFAHLYAEAGKLAQADRRHFVGDPGFVNVPVAALVDPAHVAQRARGIDPFAPPWACLMTGAASALPR
jgi:gamma-glutamyltranspeptidase